MDDLEKLLKRNAAWARRSVRADPDFFNRLSKQQKPEYLWIGCSDSRVPANQIVDMQPGEVFVHRNVANVVAHSDLNCQAVIQFAVDALKVKHIMVVGHYGCGGVKAAMGGHTEAASGYWLGHVREVHDRHREIVDVVKNSEERWRLLAELNVLEQAINVINSSTVLKAWERGQKLSIHGWIYGLEDGLLRHLDLSVGAPVNVAQLRAESVAMILAEHERQSLLKKAAKKRSKAAS